MQDINYYCYYFERNKGHGKSCCEKESLHSVNEHWYSKRNIPALEKQNRIGDEFT